MNKIPGWILIPAVLLITAIPFRFVLKGYSYIAHTLTFFAFLIVLHHFLPARLWKILQVAVAIGLLYFSALEIRIFSDARGEKDPERKYLVVLGGEVIGTRPSRSLGYRISEAIQYLNDYPDSIAILSGGQGENEGISEAQCMFNSITEQGIAPERLILEDKSTSTLENLENSLEIIRQMGDDPTGNTAILSSSYHLCRAKMMARNLGVAAAGVACYPGWFLLAANFYIREAFGITHLMVFGN